ncbi:MAG: chromate transporter, partial [Bacillus sp. (in: firmicutes)]
TWDFYKKSYQTLGIVNASVTVVASLLLLEFLHLHPAVLIVAILVFALVKKDNVSKVEKKGERGVG